MKNKVGVCIILIILTLFVSLQSNIYAMDAIMDSAESFLETGADEGVINEEALKSTSDYLYNILLTVAIALAVIVGAIIGIQFMIGSVEEKAKVKETLIPYIIGIFIIFASFTIWKIVVSIGNDIIEQTETSHPHPGGGRDLTV